MAKKQVKVEIVAEGSEKFSAEMRKGAKSVRDFGSQAGASSSGLGALKGALGGVTSALAPMAAAFASGATVIAAFDKAMSTSQALGDEYARCQEAVKTSIDEFFYAVANGDFTNLNNGLIDLALRAREAYDALDQLGNSTMSYGVIQAKENAAITEAMANLRGLKKGTAEYQAELDKMQTSIGNMKSGAEIMQGDIVKTLQTQLQKDTGIKWNTITLDDIVAQATLDATVDRDKVKAEAAVAYEEYKKELEKLNRESTETVTVGFGEGQSTYERVKDQEAYNAKVAELNAKYKESIIQNAMLNKYSDEQLQKLDGQLSTFYALNTQISQYEGKWNKLKAGDESAVSGGNAGKNEGLALKAQYDKETLETAVADMLALVQNRLDNGEPVKIPIAAGDLGSGFMEDEEGNIWSTEEVDAWEQRTMDAADMVAKRMQNVRKSVDESSKAFSAMGSLAGSVGTMVGGELGNLIGTMGSMIGQIGSVIASLTTEKAAEAGAAVASGAHKVAATSAHWYEIIPGIAAVTAAIVSTLAGFEQGGVVGGSSYSGDKMLIRANSGERVLTAEQNEIFENLLEGGGDTGGVNNKQRVQFEIKNDRLVGTLSNASARQRYRV